MKFLTTFYEETGLGVVCVGQTNKEPPIIRSVIHSPFAAVGERYKVVEVDRVSKTETIVVVQVITSK